MLSLPVISMPEKIYENKVHDCVLSLPVISNALRRYMRTKYMTACSLLKVVIYRWFITHDCVCDVIIGRAEGVAQIGGDIRAFLRRSRGGRYDRLGQ